MTTTEMASERAVTMTTSEVWDWDPLYSQVEGMHVWRDMLCLPCMPPSLMDHMVDNFRFKDGDVILASYPQSSFFWIQDVLWHLHHLDTLEVPISQKPELANRVPFLEHEFKHADPVTLLRDYPTPRLMKTHLSHRYWADNLRHLGEHKVKVILWTAEPKDVVANYCDYWNIKGEFFKFPKIEWNHFFRLFKEKRLFEGDWYEMNLSWMDHFEGKDNFLHLTYEESRKNPDGCVKKMAEFLGVGVSEGEVQQVAGMREFDKWPDWRLKFEGDQAGYTDKLTRKALAGSTLAKYYPVK